MLRRRGLGRGIFLRLILLWATPALAGDLAISEQFDAVEHRYSAVIDRVAQPIALGSPCTDKRYPQLVGTTLLYCSPSGAPDRVLNLDTNQRLRLQSSAKAPTVYTGKVYAPGRAHGLWRLPARSPADGLPIPDAVAPVGFDGQTFAIPRTEGVEVGRIGESIRLNFLSTPAPWYPAASTMQWALWVEWSNGVPHIMSAPPGLSEAVVFAKGPHWHHHVAASKGYVTWVDNGDIRVAHLDSQTHYRESADSGFESRPALFSDHVCWGDRGDGDLTVKCIDGWSVPGRRPTGGGPLLLVQTPHSAMLYAARWWPLWPDEKGKLQIPALWGTGSITVQIRDENGEWVTHSELRLQTGENRSIQVPIGATARAIPEHPLPEGLR